MARLTLSFLPLTRYGASFEVRYHFILGPQNYKNGGQRRDWLERDDVWEQEGWGLQAGRYSKNSTFQEKKTGKIVDSN